MGWTGLHYTGDVLEYCNNEIWADHCQVLASSRRKNIVYQAVKNNKTGEVFAGVILYNINNKDYYNFHYKPMSDDVGPSGSDCPLKILKLLTPTDSQWANEWRERQYKQLKQNKQKIQDGDLIVFDDVITFVNGDKHKQFRASYYYTRKGKRRRCFAADGKQYRISGWKDLPHTIVPQTAIT